MAVKSLGWWFKWELAGLGFQCEWASVSEVDFIILYVAVHMPSVFSKMSFLPFSVLMFLNL